MLGGPSVRGGKEASSALPMVAGLGWGGGVDFFPHWELKPWGCVGCCWADNPHCAAWWPGSSMSPPCCPHAQPLLARQPPSTQAALVSPADANGITPTLSLHPLPRHEDGTVRFWDASGVSLKPLYKLGTANIFQTDCEHNDSLNQAGEEEWPPFRKVTSPGLGGGTHSRRHTPCCSPSTLCLLGGM